MNTYGTPEPLLSPLEGNALSEGIGRSMAGYLVQVNDPTTQLNGSTLLNTNALLKTSTLLRAPPGRSARGRFTRR